MQLKTLIVDDVHPSLFPLLEEINVAFDYHPDITRDEIKKRIAGYHILIIRSKTRVDQDLLLTAVNLKVVCRAGAGIDNLEEEVLQNKKIAIINAPEGNRDAVAEHCMGLLLSLFTKINLADRQVRERVWDREGNRGIELKGKSVGVIGYGNMGSAFVERLKSFNCRILVFDKYKSGFESDNVKEAKMSEIFQEADILSFHLPLTSETRNMADQDFFNKFRKNIYIINTSRGEILPLSALVNGLKSGKILGAALDVLENEKLSSLTEKQNGFFNYLINSDKVLLTPHVAGWSAESYKRINEVMVDKLVKWMEQNL